MPFYDVGRGLAVRASALSFSLPLSLSFSLTLSLVLSHSISLSLNFPLSPSLYLFLCLSLSPIFFSHSLFLFLSFVVCLDVVVCHRRYYERAAHKVSCEKEVVLKLQPDTPGAPPGFDAIGVLVKDRKVGGVPQAVLTHTHSGGH
jgi:hypothetical protein